MENRLQVIKTSTKLIAGLPSKLYAQIKYDNQEIGFITTDGIYMRFENTDIPEGVLYRLDIYSDKKFADKCKLIEKHWQAIYDHYPLKIRNSK